MLEKNVTANHCTFIKMHGVLVLLLLPAVAMGFTQGASHHAFRPSRLVCHSSIDSDSPDDDTSSSTDAPLVEAVVVDPNVVLLQKELLKIATNTNRGFTASSADRNRAREIIFDLADRNPTLEPASPFYNTTATKTDADSPTLAGKWTLVYTDAPDIIGLDLSGPLATAKLGRIGQECTPPYIKNVIEWRRPDWASALPFSGTDESRVLQKVVTEATASPDRPLMVDLKLVGIEVVGVTSNTNTTNFQESIQEDGLPAAWFKQNPLEFKGPLTAPFGQFEILYLDDQFRIIKTGQNFLAVNVRNELDWF